MKVRTNKTKAKTRDNPASWNTPMERLRSNAMVEEEKYVFSHWNMDSDIQIEPVTVAFVDVKCANLDIPSIWATLLDDFAGEVFDEESGKTFRYHFRKISFGRKRVDRMRVLGRFGAKKFTPAAEIMVECEGDKIGNVICDLPNQPMGDRTAYLPSTFGASELMQHFASKAISAMLAVQNELLHRPRTVKRDDSVSDEPLERATATKKPREKKAGTVISLRKTHVHIETDRRFRWTEYWIVGGYIRQQKVKNGAGGVVVKATYIQPYLKGPERESEEALASLQRYLDDDMAKKAKIVL